jgi:hypothetical protein
MSSAFVKRNALVPTLRVGTFLATLRVVRPEIAAERRGRHSDAERRNET